MLRPTGARRARPPGQPHGQHGQPGERILAREREAAEGGAREQQPARARRVLAVDARERVEQCRREEEIERHLVDEPREEDRGPVQREHEARDEADPAREEAPARGGEQEARSRPERRLREADDERARPCDGVQDREEVRIEGRLIEHLVAQPVARDDGARPGVVGDRVAHEDAAEVGAVDLEQIDDADEEGQEEQRERQAGVRRAFHGGAQAHERARAHAAGSGGSATSSSTGSGTSTRASDVRAASFARTSRR